MFRRFGGGGSSSSWEKKPKNPHSLDQLKYLYTVMAKNEQVTEQNKTLLVETLRSVAEILIWGDQNDSTVFDFFLEKNMLSYFLSIMTQRCGTYVCVQLLQTLNILFENIRNETSIYYLLSNNHVNSIITHKFDFSDEEVMAYYISFLKTLSLKLNQYTIHFFFNETTNDFPLYTEAITFFNHSEKMVRIAVRTLTLNVFKVEEKSALNFICDKTAAPYFSNLVWFIGNHVLNIDNLLKQQDFTQQKIVRLDDLVAEHLDHLHYLNDILLLNISDLNTILTGHLLNRLLIPLYIYSLLTSTPQAGTAKASERPHTSRVTSLFLVSQVFLILSYEPLVQSLVEIILHSNMSIFREPEFARPTESLVESLSQATNRPCGDQQQYLPSNRPASSSVPTSPKREAVTHCSSLQTTTTNYYSETQDSSSLTDEEKAQQAAASQHQMSIAIKRTTAEPDEEKPVLEAILNSLDVKAQGGDHGALFSLCLLFAILENPGVRKDVLKDIVVFHTDDLRADPSSLRSNYYCNKLLDLLTEILNSASQFGSRIRLVTLDMALTLLKKITIKDGKCVLSDHHLATIEQAKENANVVMRNVFQQEDESLFLDTFEDEYQEMNRKKLNVEYLMMDANLLLPPEKLNPMIINGIDITRRLPCGELERVRYGIRVFFLLRQFSLAISGEQETCLPLAHQDSLVKLDQLLDLSNSDLFGCVAFIKDQPKQRRFMVIDTLQLILIEPDTRRLGWGIARMTAMLQDIEVTPDKEDARSLHVSIKQAGQFSAKRTIINVRFAFDDHIRCLAAKQRLTKGRLKARQKKMERIAKLIDLPLGQGSDRRFLPSDGGKRGNVPGHIHRPLVRNPEASTSGSSMQAATESGRRPILKHSPHGTTAQRSVSSSRRSGSRTRSSESDSQQQLNIEEMIPLKDMTGNSPAPERRTSSSMATDPLTAMAERNDSEHSPVSSVSGASTTSPHHGLPV